MVFLVAAKEIKEIVRSGQFKWMLGIVVLLSMVATYISHVLSKRLRRSESSALARKKSAAH